MKLFVMAHGFPEGFEDRESGQIIRQCPDTLTDMTTSPFTASLDCRAKDDQEAARRSVIGNRPPTMRNSQAGVAGHEVNGQTVLDPLLLTKNRQPKF